MEDEAMNISSSENSRSPKMHNENYNSDSSQDSEDEDAVKTFAIKRS